MQLMQKIVCDLQRAALARPEVLIWVTDTLAHLHDATVLLTSDTLVHASKHTTPSDLVACEEGSVSRER